MDPELKKMLVESGLPWEVEDGRKHMKLRVCGRLVLCLPHGGKKAEDNQRARKNAQSALRRFIRERQACFTPAAGSGSVSSSESTDEER